MRPFLLNNGAVSSRGDSITLWGRLVRRIANKNKKKPLLRPGLWSIPPKDIARSRARFSLHDGPLLLRTYWCRGLSAVYT